MANTYCLAIEAKSPHIEGGLGYLLSFRTSGELPPEKTPGFSAWAQAVRTAVLDAGDQPFNPDPYTRKVAIAELMYEIEKINSLHGFKIEGSAQRPAVEVQSSNPHDKRIQANFLGEDGRFDVVEKPSLLGLPGRIQEDGKTSVLDADTAAFPFTPAIDDIKAPRRHLGFGPHL